METLSPAQSRLVQEHILKALKARTRTGGKPAIEVESTEA